VARPEKTDPVPVCLDADVLIAGLLSCTGASHAILVLGEIGLLHLVLPEAAVEEVRRNLSAKAYETIYQRLDPPERRRLAQEPH